MKVIRKDEPIKLTNLRVGDVFQCLDGYYMVLDKYDSERARQLCVDIETGQCTYLDYELIVVRYEAEVVLK